MVQVLEEYGGILLAFLAGVFLIGMVAAMGEDGGLIYQFIVYSCSGAV